MLPHIAKEFFFLRYSMHLFEKHVRRCTSIHYVNSGLGKRYSVVYQRQG